MFKESVQTAPEFIYTTVSFQRLCPFPPQDHADLRSHFFTVGMKLETVNLSEPFHICPASVTKVSFPPLLFTSTSRRPAHRGPDGMCWLQGGPQCSEQHTGAEQHAGRGASAFSPGHAVPSTPYVTGCRQPGWSRASCCRRDWGSYGPHCRCP